jgi:hypothetical protein
MPKEARGSSVKSSPTLLYKRRELSGSLLQRRELSPFPL